jgi:hypothetical protein
MERPRQSPRSPHKKSASLEVQIMFEPSRLAQPHLQDAYVYLVPTVRRRLSSTQSTVTPAQSSAERNVQ